MKQACLAVVLLAGCSSSAEEPAPHALSAVLGVSADAPLRGREPHPHAVHDLDARPVRCGPHVVGTLVYVVLLAALLWLIPLPLRNLGYRCVAAGRYKLFGQLETCRMPTDAERQRFLP